MGRGWGGEKRERRISARGGGAGEKRERRVSARRGWAGENDYWGREAAR